MGVARTFQNVELFSKHERNRQHAAEAATTISRARFIQEALFGYRAAEEASHRRKVEEVIDFLEMEQWRKHLVSMLPYGVQKRVELGRALAQEPKLLLLDEPMAGMNLEETEDIARFIIDIHEELGTYDYHDRARHGRGDGP